MNRLETLSQTMAEELGQATPDEQRAAALAACEFAVPRAELQHARVEEALESLRMGRHRLSQRQRSGMEALVRRLDGEYFDLQEAAEKTRECADKCLRKFAQARAASAVLFAFGDDPYEASSESLYEAASAVEDKAALFDVVKSALR
jgi:hypothetical protein